MRTAARLLSTAAARAEPRLTPGVARLTERTFVRGRGSWVWADDGTQFLDFTCGIAVTNTGHAHPHVVAAVQAQAERMLHCQIGVGNQEPMQQLMRRLQPLLPAELTSFFFWNSGAEAIEAAVKMARQHTNRPNVIVFHGGYHGRTMGTMGLTTSKTIYRERFGPFMPGGYVAPFPYAAQLPCQLAGSPQDAVDYCLHQVELLLKQQTAPSETAAMLIEPVLGEGGYVPAPAEFLHGLRRICDKHGILLVFDEVQTGFGRTGKMFALEHSGVVPDILVMSKGIASGMPLSAVAAKPAITSAQPPGCMGGTFAGNIVSCAAALATLDVFEQEGLLANTEARGQQLTEQLTELKTQGYAIGEVRGPGLMVGVELDAACPPGTASRIGKALHEHDYMLLLTCSAFEVLRFIPPLNVTSQEIDLGVHKFRQALDRLELRRHR